MDNIHWRPAIVTTFLLSKYNPGTSYLIRLNQRTGIYLRWIKVCLLVTAYFVADVY